MEEFDQAELDFREQADGRKVARLPTGKVVIIELGALTRGNTDGACRTAGYFVDFDRARRYLLAGGNHYAGFYYLADFTLKDPLVPHPTPRPPRIQTPGRPAGKKDGRPGEDAWARGQRADDGGNAPHGHRHCHNAFVRLAAPHPPPFIGQA